MDRLKIQGESGYEGIILNMEFLGETCLTHLTRTALKELHEKMGCNAHAEGLYCCLDFVLGDFEKE